jgi:hypothetical protein
MDIVEPGSEDPGLREQIGSPRSKRPLEQLFTSADERAAMLVFKRRSHQAVANRILEYIPDDALGRFSISKHMIIEALLPETAAMLLLPHVRRQLFEESNEFQKVRLIVLTFYYCVEVVRHKAVRSDCKKLGLRSVR